MTTPLPDTPDPSKKSFLTHNRGKEEKKPVAPDPEIQKPEIQEPEIEEPELQIEESELQELQIEESELQELQIEKPQIQEPQIQEPEIQEPQILEAHSVKKQSVNPAALSGKMAKISSLRESGGLSSKQTSNRDKTASTLPGAMARLHRKHQEEEIRDRVQGKPSLLKDGRFKEKPSTSLQVDDPDPGLAKSTLLFWVLFGRFAKSVMLAQSLQVTLLFFLLTGLGSIEWSMAFLSPLPEPGEIYNPFFAGKVIAGGMLLGMGLYFLLSLALNLIVHRLYGGIGKIFGLKVVVNAFLPLAIGQLFFITLGSFWMGESYWRGMMYPEFEALRNWVLPALWLWGGYRIAQAVTSLFDMPFLTRLWTKVGVLLLAALPIVISQAAFIPFGGRALIADWEQLKRDVMVSGAALPIERYDAMEKRLAFHDTDRKRDLYLYRMQALYRLDALDKARADALRLDRMAFAGSADDELAKGLNYLFQNRLDLALPKFNVALALDPSCNPAHQWSALGLAAFDLDQAEKHARILMQNAPNVFHLQLLVRILFASEKYQEIWDSTLMVDAPPENWDPVTLHQSGLAAAALGKTRRSEYLLSLARGKGIDSDGE